MVVNSPAWPSGKAVGFGPTIPGSSPGAGAGERRIAGIERAGRRVQTPRGRGGRIRPHDQAPYGHRDRVQRVVERRVARAEQQVVQTPSGAHVLLHDARALASKSAQLGMPYGTAANRLRKRVLFNLAERLGVNVCATCHQRITEAEELTIAHKHRWHDTPDGAARFWDLENVVYIHRQCRAPE